MIEMYYPVPFYGDKMAPSRAENGTGTCGTNIARNFIPEEYQDQVIYRILKTNLKVCVMCL